ncbi:ATP-binding protein [Clostridium sp. JN-1]|uniref:sensor histidine kinase n=1 Tax=Clostridium sp. JN-1 TaxID=2483110 RepID=UPI000F0B94A0|nr:ATP-binding protein [Clostridium sp. JN-1]
MYNTIIHYNNEEEYKKCILNIDKFLESVNCNVRSSINNINGAADLSLMTNVNIEQKQYLNLIKSNTLNVLNVLNTAVDFLKIQFCNMKVEKVEFNFKDFIDDIVKPSSKEAICNDVKFEIDIDEGIPNVLIGDIVKLRQVLISIIEGAIKFTKHGMISFMIEVINSSQKQIDLRFKVKTSSTAFCKNNVLKFFENLNKPNGKYCIENLNDSMIGIYIVSEIVKVMDSQINVVSKKNIGTTFSFDLLLEISKKSSLIDIDVDNKNDRESLQPIIKNNTIYEDSLFLYPL